MVGATVIGTDVDIGRTVAVARVQCRKYELRGGQQRVDQGDGKSVLALRHAELLSKSAAKALAVQAVEAQAMIAKFK